jgi:hypothetical protein
MLRRRGHAVPAHLEVKHTARVHVGTGQVGRERRCVPVDRAAPVLGPVVQLASQRIDLLLRQPAERDERIERGGGASAGRDPLLLRDVSHTRSF